MPRMNSLLLVRYLLTILACPAQRKHAYRWFQSACSGSPLRAKTPWIIYDAIDYLVRDMPNRPMTVFEYGSGGSTLFWSGWGKRCVSIEHDPAWFSLVRSRLTNLKADYRLVLPEAASADAFIDSANPTHYASAHPSFRGQCFKSYVSQIDSFSDGYFDVVMIDGRARPSCIMHSSRKVRPAGFLILDDAQRAHYAAQTQIYLQDFSRMEFYGVGPCSARMWRTDIYVRH